MLIKENILLALSGLKSNKMRSLLTMLGIIIGISSVIAIMTVGNSINASVSTSMQEMGANNLTVGVKQKSSTEEVTREGMKFGAGGSKSMSAEDNITDEMITAFEEQYKDEISMISISSTVGSGTVDSGSNSANISLVGGNEGYISYSDLNLVTGRSITTRDQEEGRKVILVSDQLVDCIFEGNYSSALSQPINISIDNNYETFTIVGVYEYEESSSFSSESSEEVTTDIYLPLKSAKEQYHLDDGYTQLVVISQTGTDNSSFMEDVEYFFNIYYAKNDNYEISVTSMESMLESMTSMLSTISVAISIIAGISLLVGGIGVMNIMLVSITERTREIGTRKALGATNGSIRLQFITESIVICLVGGFIGIVLGLSFGGIAVLILGYSASASIGSIFFSVIFSIMIGVFFGYYPANKAAKLSPIDALRFE